MSHEGRPPSDPVAEEEADKAAEEMQTHPHLHERDEPPRRTLLLLLVFTMLLSGGISVGAWGIQHAREKSIRPAGEYPEKNPPRPGEVQHVEQVIFDQDFRGQALRKAQQKVLESWGWVDRDQGRVRVPIEVAIEILARGQGGRP